jgi:hypothetical protein
VEGRETGKLRQAIETMKVEYIRGLNLGFTEYKMEELFIPSYSSVVHPT